MTNLYGKIEPELNENVHPNTRAVILYDPSELYSRINFDKFQRRQSFGMGLLFPNKKGVCACGCGNKFIGRQTRWYSEECQKIPLGVLGILNGNLEYICRLLQVYQPHRCVKCDCENYLIEKTAISDYHGREYISYSASGLQVDHIVAIQNGGSAGWLGNYQFLCHRCHSIKTKSDNLEKRQRLSGGFEQQNIFPAKIISL